MRGASTEREPSRLAAGTLEERCQGPAFAASDFDKLCSPRQTCSVRAWGTQEQPAALGQKRGVRQPVSNYITMSAELQARAQSFLKRPHPAGLAYAPGSMAEQFIAAYANDGHLDLDPESGQMLEICAFEAFEAAKRRAGEQAAFFQETAEILQAIQAEAQA